MEMLPDQKPPIPRGKGPLGKAIFFGTIALVLGSIALYIMFPPLKIIGEITLRDGGKLVAYNGISTRVRGKPLYVAIIETPENATVEKLTNLAVSYCEEALEQSFLLDNSRRRAPYGEMTVRFVQGGRYFYRFYNLDDWQMVYARGTCTVAPYLSGDLEGWAFNRWKFTDDDGESELEVWFRWTGSSERPDFPMKEVCEKVVSSPPRELRARMSEDVDTITIAAEWELFGGFDIISWRSSSFQRVDNLCLKIGPVEEEA